MSLVFDRQAPIYGLEKRRAVARALDDLVMQTGARVRVFPNAGATEPPAWDCTLDEDGPAEGGTFLWGEDFTPKLSARPRLDCVYAGAKSYPGGTDEDGDWMFSGLLAPVLDHDDWPSPQASISVGLLLSQVDDDEGSMQGRPGMASEAFIRLAARGDRRRAVAFAAGSAPDELETFTLALGPRSRTMDWDTDDLDDALQGWLPDVVSACEDSEMPPLPQPPGGCAHIDILFVVDGSLSMEAEQAALRGVSGPPVFAEFAEALSVQLETLQDVHVGVVSSEPGDTALHTHLDQPAMASSAATDCGLSPGTRWIVGPSSSLAEEFSCLASTMSESTVETTALNAAEALADPANAGFLRDDAVLFVVMLTDEDTQGFETSRVEIHDALLDAVDGRTDRLVVLGIAGDQGTFEAPKTTCTGPYGTASPGRRLSSIAFSFAEQGLMQDICAGDLASSFDAALDELVDTCENFHPEG